MPATFANVGRMIALLGFVAVFILVLVGRLGLLPEGVLFAMAFLAVLFFP